VRSTTAVTSTLTSFLVRRLDRLLSLIQLLLRRLARDDLLLERSEALLDTLGICSHYDLLTFMILSRP
jgi:hypothetical protein